MAQAILTNGKLDTFPPPKNPDRWPQWLSDYMHCLRSALIAHRDGGRVVAGASFGRAQALEKILVRTIQVLISAGFRPLHAGLAASTTIDYVWGFVIEEQSGPAPEEISQMLNEPDDQMHLRDGDQEDHFSDKFMEEYSKMPMVDVFDWGLQVIIAGLKTVKEST